MYGYKQLKTEDDMDYKESLKTLEWNLAYSNLKLAEIKILAMMICRQNYRDGTFAGSLHDISKSVQISKPSASNAIAKLIDKELIVRIKKQQGAKPAVYRVRDSSDLDDLNTVEKNNPELDAWYDEREKLFGSVISRIDSVIDGCDQCESAESDDEYCDDHKHIVMHHKKSLPYKRYQIWLKDKPQPQQKIKTINGVVV